MQFKCQNDWRIWLDQYHRKVDGLWMKIGKKDAEVESIAYD